MALLRNILVGLAIGACALTTLSAPVSVTRQYVKLILVQQKDKKGNWENAEYGSSVVIAPNYVLTADHIISDRGNGRVIFIGDTEKEAKVVKENKGLDLALLHIPNTPCPCVQIASHVPEIDTEVSAVGFPLFHLFPVQYLTTGYLQREFKGRLFATTNIAPGSSGGGLFTLEDGNYKLIGITSRVVNQDKQQMNWMGIFVSSDVIKMFLKGTPVE